MVQKWSAHSTAEAGADTTTAARERLTHLLAAANGLLSALRSGDGAGLLTFSDALRVRARMTQDIASVRAALPGIVGEGQTALRDAVQLGLALRPNDGTRGLLLLVFTDGVDTASWLSDEAVIESARRAFWKLSLPP
jgi:Mg-chelatase subunit ChlD